MEKQTRKSTCLVSDTQLPTTTEPTRNSSAGLIFTKHALARCRQRGLNLPQVQAVVACGRRLHGHSGATLWFVPKGPCPAATAQGLQLDALRSILVVTQNNVVVTVMHLHDRVPNDRTRTIWLRRARCRHPRNHCLQPRRRHSGPI